MPPLDWHEGSVHLLESRALDRMQIERARPILQRHSLRGHHRLVAEAKYSSSMSRLMHQPNRANAKLWVRRNSLLICMEKRDDFADQFGMNLTSNVRVLNSRRIWLGDAIERMRHTWQNFDSVLAMFGSQ